MQLKIYSQEHKMKSELVQFEKEEAEKRLQAVDRSEEDLSLVEAKATTPAEKVLDVVRAVETLAQGPIENSVPPKSPGGPNSELKTTTIVMSKHTLAAQPTTVSNSLWLWVFAYVVVGALVEGAFVVCCDVLLPMLWLDFGKWLVKNRNMP